MYVRPMTVHEMYGTITDDHWLARYLQNPQQLQKQFQGIITIPSLSEVLWRGGMPGTVDLSEQALSSYFSSYVQTYIERDVQALEQIKDSAQFGSFFALLGGLTAQEMNHAQLWRDRGITPATAQRWLNLLQYTYQWHTVLPYHGNAIKRISGKSKGYFADSGIACYMQRISSPQSLAAHPLLGSLFESFCFTLVQGLSVSLPMKPRIYHWRTIGGAEIDLILELDGKLYPIEMKCKTNLTGHDTRGMQALRQTYDKKNIMPGIILYAGKECYMLDEHTIALPWNSI